MKEGRFVIPAMAGVLGIAAIAAAAEPTTAELREQIEALQKKVNQIEAREATSAQQQATLQSVLDDAQRRSQLLQTGGITAGYEDGKGFHISSANGDFRINPYAQFQFRGVANYGEGVQDDGDDSIDSGFEVRRMKFGFKGHAFKDFKYDFRWATARSGGGLTLENAFVEYAFGPDNMSLKVGQWKDNVFHEESTSSSRQLAVDRSLLNETLAGGETDYIQGIAFLYGGKDTPFRTEIALHDGANSDNTNYEDNGKNYGGSVRAEYKFMGDWKSYDDFSAMKNKENLFVLGGGANYTETGDVSTIYHTIDAQYEFAAMPLGLYAAYIGQMINDDADDAYNWGALAQAGYMLNTNWELFGRFGFMDLDDDESFTEYTVGVNYYWHGHNAKATVDVTVLPDGAPDDDSGIGVQGGDDFQAVLRAQFQLAF